MFHIPFLMVFYHVRTIIVPIGICVSPFICGGVYNLINCVIAHSPASVSVCTCMCACLHVPKGPSMVFWIRVLIFPRSAYRPALRGFCSVYEAGVLTQFVALVHFLWFFPPTLHLPFFPPAGAYCEPARLERRVRSFWTKRHTHHWAALPTSPISSLSLGSVCASESFCVCMCVACHTCPCSRPVN